jgi:Predicted pPIWI-associating nuclease
MTSSDWRDLRERAELLQQDISRVQAVNVNSREVRSEAELLASDYFRAGRPLLLGEGVSASECSALDEHAQALVKLAQGRNQKLSYVKVLRHLRKEMARLEVTRLGAIAKAGNVAPANNGGLSTIESTITKTLQEILPSAALSYEQACRDLATDRTSYRGTAVELREALREVLDRLAPDEDVKKMAGFKPETQNGGPSMRQKARYILKARDIPDTAAKAPEDAVSVVEEAAASLVRSTYQLGSLGTHIKAERGKVQQLKMYVDTVLCEMLKIHG